ncbi:MAG: radical SAM protein [Nitrospirae bacterium]|nr:radical SAM protein [Nitrospirota bacterium]
MHSKLLLMNIPSGRIPSDYPPIAISRVIEGIEPSLNVEVSFLNLDYLRPSLDEIKNKIESFKPDIVGFSAVLTPAYRYLKELSNFIGKNFPSVIQVLGGEMAVIANIVLLKTKVNFCITGESEPSFSNLILRLKKDNFKPETKNYRDILGLVFLLDGMPYFTGTETNDSRQNGLRQFNYKLMSGLFSLNNYIHKIDGQYFRSRLINNRIEGFLDLLHPHNQHKNMAMVFASKGCINKCSFCHRFFKGYRFIDPVSVINYIEALKMDLDVGMALFSEENFGTNTKATSLIIEYLRDSRLNWGAGAVRVRTVNEKTIRLWKQAGCVHINFGIESLSQKMLDVMDKRATVEENLNAIMLCHKYGIFTIIGLVIGMPGETEQTIQETIDNLTEVIPDDINIPFEVYVNYVQTVPGTPIYEYAKRLGLIGRSLDEEEKYIEGLSEADANEVRQYLNFTDYLKEETAYWKYYISMELIASYIRKNGYFNVLRHKKTRAYRVGLLYVFFPKRVRRFLLKYLMIARFFGLRRLMYICKEKAFKLFMKKVRNFGNVNRPIREINKELTQLLREDEVAVVPLREG